MIVYRITLARYADKLYAPGTAGRWNEQGRLVIYTAGSVSLACLENLVHRSAISLQADYRVMYIDIPDSISIGQVGLEQLGNGWEQSSVITRKLGNDWLNTMDTCVLRVPSAIIAGEFNWLINPSHPQFGYIRLVESQAFRFDQRLKS